MTDTRHISGDIDLTSWGFDDVTTSTEVTQVLRREFRDDPPRVDLAYMYWPTSDGWHGTAVTDPLALNVMVPLGKYSDEDVPVFRCSVTELVEDAISFFVSWDTGKVVDKADRRLLRKMADRLRKAADRIDAVCSDAAPALEPKP